LNLPFFIARRYLFSKRKKNFINVISILSMVGVALTTAALVIVLSVFNGLGDLLKTLNNSFDPEIKIVASKGKSFQYTPELKETIEKIDGVSLVTEVIEDYAYLRYRKADQVVTIKGVSDNFLEQKRIPEGNIVEGTLRLRDGDVNYAIIGRGVQMTLSIAVNDPLFPLEVYYIKNVKPSAAILDPSQYYARQTITPGAVFSIVQSFDENYVVVPLDFARDLLNYGAKRTSLEIKTHGTRSSFAVEDDIQAKLGSNFNVLNHEEQHDDLYRLLKMEKLFSFLALTLLLIIGSINIFFCLMMLALDKKKDITILSSVGATDRIVRNIFLAEGVLIASLGAVTGLVIGGVLCWLQQRYGFISMGMETSVTHGYPVKVEWIDFVSTLGVVAFITTLISLRPAKLAAGLVVHSELLGKQ
jgi:lipoprotein-releasing system permease protein